MSDQRLKSIADRIERLMDERDGLASDIRDLFAEAKGVGYVPKVLRKAITRKRMDASKRDEEDAILELYEDALGSVGKAVAAVRAGSTWKEAAEEHGVPRATLARAVAVSKRQAQSRNDTGDATLLVLPGESNIEDATPHGHSFPRASQTEAIPEPTVSPAPDGGAGTGTCDSGPIPSFLRRQKAALT